MNIIELEKYRDSAGFRFLDWQFGELLVRRGKNLPEKYRDAMILLGAKCLMAAEQGHSCLDLAAWSEPVPEDCEDAQLSSPLSPPSSLHSRMRSNRSRTDRNPFRRRAS